MSEKKQRKPLSIPIFIAVYVTVIVACVALDQLTKYLIDKATTTGYDSYGNAMRKTIPVLGNWLTLSWTTNTGATGSMFSTLKWRNWLFFIMTVIGIPVFCWLLWRSRTRSVWGQVAFSFVIGGTIGNAIDRIAFAQNGFFTGAVRDFVRVEGFFGIFNVADSFLVVGVIMALLAIVVFDYDSLLWSIVAERKAKREGVQSDVDVADTSLQDGEQNSPIHTVTEEQTDENDSSGV